MSQKSFLNRKKRSGALYRQIARNEPKVEMRHCSTQTMLPTEILQPTSSTLRHIEQHENEALMQRPEACGNVSECSDNYNLNEDEYVPNLDVMSTRECVRYWALETDAPHSSIKLILEILRRKTNADVPKDPRTLLETNVGELGIVNITDGQYWYHGISKCLKTLFNIVKIPNTNKLSLNISIDGLPLHKSSNKQFWPILVNINEMPHTAPMVVAIFRGEKKPGVLEEYLRPLVDELNILIVNGINMQGQHLQVGLRAIIADAPARAFVKGVINFNGLHGCLKCTVVGGFDPDGQTVVFKGTNAPKRTDAGFRLGAYPKHTMKSTPLLDILNFNIIEDIVVSDRLHLIDLGVMKRLLSGWRDGNLGPYRKWQPPQVKAICDLFKVQNLPSEIHRKLRPLQDVRHWKGTEYCTFMHYSSIVVLRGILSDTVYQHYMLLYCAITLMSTDFYKQHWALAGQLLNKFVADYRNVYGERYLTSNVHNLQHVADEVIRFGALPTISSYTFENKLQNLKNTLRSMWKELEQAIRRNSEREKIHYRFHTNVIAYPAIAKRQYKQKEITTIHIRRGFLLENTESNKWFLTKTNAVIEFQNVVRISGGIHINGKILRGTENYYDFPFESHYLLTFKGNTTQLAQEYSTFTVNDVRCKLVAIVDRHPNTVVFTPLLHTLTH